MCVCAPLMVLGRTPNASLSGWLFILHEHLWNASFYACLCVCSVCGVRACVCACVCSVPTPLYGMTCAYSPNTVTQILLSFFTPHIVWYIAVGLAVCQTTEDTIRVTMKQHNISLSATAESQLKTYLETEAEYSVVSSKLRPLTKQSNNIGYAAKMGLHELENIQSTARALGLKMKVSACLLSNSVLGIFLNFIVGLFDMKALKTNKHHMWMLVCFTLTVWLLYFW